MGIADFFYLPWIISISIASHCLLECRSVRVRARVWGSRRSVLSNLGFHLRANMIWMYILLCSWRACENTWVLLIFCTCFVCDGLRTPRGNEVLLGRATATTRCWHSCPLRIDKVQRTDAVPFNAGLTWQRGVKSVHWIIKTPPWTAHGTRFSVPTSLLLSAPYPCPCTGWALSDNACIPELGTLTVNGQSSSI